MLNVSACLCKGALVQYHHPNGPYWSPVSELQWSWYSTLIVVQILWLLRCIKLTRRVGGWTIYSICPTIFRQVLHWHFLMSLPLFHCIFQAKFPHPRGVAIAFASTSMAKGGKGWKMTKPWKHSRERNFAQVPWCTLPTRYTALLWKFHWFFSGLLLGINSLQICLVRLSMGVVTPPTLLCSFQARCYRH